MSKYQGSLQEWRRYIDEKTRAVRDRKEGRAAVADEERAAASAEPMEDTAQAASDQVEAILAKHRAIAEEINQPPPSPVTNPAAAAPAAMPDASIIEAAAMFARGQRATPI